MLGTAGGSPEFEKMLLYLYGGADEDQNEVIFGTVRAVVLAAAGNVWWRLHRPLSCFPCKLLALAEPETPAAQQREASGTSRFLDCCPAAPCVALSWKLCISNHSLPLRASFRLCASAGAGGARWQAFLLLGRWVL